MDRKKEDRKLLPMHRRYEVLRTIQVHAQGGSGLSHARAAIILLQEKGWYTSTHLGPAHERIQKSNCNGHTQ